MAIIRWVHLSDLHFGYDDFTVNEFRKQLPKKLKDCIIENNAPFDYIFLTGDLRYARSNNDEEIDYATAVNEINNLCGHSNLNLSKSRVVLVPGNHDVDISEGSERMSAVKRIKQTYQTRIGKIDKETMMLLKPTKVFRKAYQQITGAEFENNHILYTDERINVLGLDSSLVCTKSSVDFGSLFLGIENVQIILSNAKNNKPLIVLAHHSIDWLQTGERKSLLHLLMDRQACVFLCGHIHTDAATEFRTFSRPDDLLCQFIAPTSMDQDETGQQTTTMGFLTGQLDTETREGAVTFFKWDIEDSVFYKRETLSLNGSIIKSPSTRPNNSDLIVHLKKQWEKAKKQSGSYILSEISSELFPSLQNDIGRIYTNEKNKDVPLLAYFEDIWSARTHKHLILTGEGGIGKTVTLLETCNELLKKGIPTVYIQLHNLKNTTIESYIEKRIFLGIISLSKEFMYMILQESADCPKAVLLLDGFNEVSEKKTLDILDDINDWWKEYPGLQIILTSRHDVRTFFTIFTNSEHLAVKPLRTEQITNYLALREIPIPNESVLQLLTYPLMLNLYVFAEGYYKQNKIQDAIRWKQDASNEGNIVWNFLQAQLQKAAFEGQKVQNVLEYVISVEYLLPYIGQKMEKSGKYAVVKSTLLDWIESGLKYFQTKWNDKGRLPQRIREIQCAYQCADLEWNIERTFRILTQELHLINIYKDKDSNHRASLIHQQFRDCFAALFQINEAEEMHFEKIPNSWNDCISAYVCDYISYLIDRKDLEKLWETMRNKEMLQGNFSLYNVFEVYRRMLLDNFSGMDFSGQDLRNISLCNIILRNDNNKASFRHAQVSQFTLIPEGHTDKINNVACLLDGKRCVSGSYDNTIKVWDVDSGKCLHTFYGHKGSVYSLACLPDGRRCISGSADKTIKVWDVDSGICLRTLEGHTKSIYSLACFPDGKHCVSGSYDETIKVWDIASGKCLRTFKGHTGSIYSLACFPDGKHFISGSSDKTIKVWDIDSDSFLRNLEGHTKSVYSLACLQDGKRFVSGSTDTTIRVWDIESGNCLRKLEGHAGSIYTLACLSDGKRFVSGSWDKTIKVWDIDSDICLRTLEGHTDCVYSLTCLPDGKRCISGSSDHTIKVWDIASGNCLRKLGGHTGSIYTLAILSDGKRYLSGSWDKTIKVWDIESGKCLRTLEGHTDCIYSLICLPDGKRCISGSNDHTIKIWDIENGKCLRTLDGHRGSVYSVDCLPDGKRCVSGSLDNTIKVWDVESGNCLHTLKGHTRNVKSVTCLPDGRHCVSGSYDDTIKVWDINKGKCLRTLKKHIRNINTVACFPNKEQYISGSSDRTIKVWDTKSGKCLQSMEGHTGSVNSVACHPDGKRCISGSFDHTIKVWDIESGRCLRTMEGHNGSVNSVVCLPDGKHCVSGSWDHTIKVWEIESGICQQTIEVLNIDIVDCDFTGVIFESFKLKELVRINGGIVD